MKIVWRLAAAVLTATVGFSLVPSSAVAITGGESAPAPSWLATYFVERQPHSVGQCTGVLVSAEWILTAAHCVTAKLHAVQLNPGAFAVVYVGADVNPLRKAHSCKPWPTGECRTVVEALMHPLFDGRGTPPRYDLAMLRLNAPVTGEPLRLATVAASAEIEPGADVDLWGYSCKVKPGQVCWDSSAKRVTLEVRTAFNSRLPWHRLPKFDGALHIAADQWHRCGDAGDSGGPLIRNRDGSAELVGIFWGSPDCDGRDWNSTPDVFTRMTYEAPPRKFVEDTMASPIPELFVIDPSIETAVQDQPYTHQFVAMGGEPPYQWTFGGLPEGLVGDSKGLVIGTPTVSGDFTVTASVADAFGRTAARTYVLEVIPVVALPTLSVADAIGYEFNNCDPSDIGRVSFPVSLSDLADHDVTVGFRTVDGSALAGEDYEAASGTLTIPQGQTSGTVVVNVYQEELDHIDYRETFRLILSDPGGALLSDSEATGYIEFSLCT